VTHDITVHHWRLEGDAEAFLGSVSRPGLEARWCDLPSVASGLGLTTWAARVLFVALRQDAAAFLASSASSASASASSASASSASSASASALAQAWQTLNERWKKCGCKV
jgi:hypothetical protein